MVRRGSLFVSSLRSLARRVARRGRIRNALLHPPGLSAPRARTRIVADKFPSPADVEIAARLLAAYRSARFSMGRDAERDDLWTTITASQSGFIRLLERGEASRLAAYLCNLSRQDAGRGIIQGDREYEAIMRDPGYRRAIGLMTKDKLVSLAEAVGVLAVENPEQGTFGRSIHLDVDVLVRKISERLGDIAPPDLDGGLLKLETAHGLFGERDLNAIFTAFLVKRLLGPSWSEADVCEIGAGTGRVAYWAVRTGVGHYTIFDLPHVNVVQGYYLLKGLGPEKVVLYDESAPVNGSPRISVLPSHSIRDARTRRFDLVLNQDSFPEIHAATVREYLLWVRQVSRGRFLSINHESRPRSAAGSVQLNVPDLVDEVGGFERVDRFPYWLRRGYVAELYEVVP